MKKLLLSFSFLFISLSIYSQVYPYSESFDAMNPFTSVQGQGGWSTTVTGFQIYTNHGNASQGMTKQMTNLGQPTDSAVTPLIGPLTSSSQLSFDYRIVLPTLYPSTAGIMGANDKIEIKVSNTTVSNMVVFTIDPSNHINSTSFVTSQVSLAAYAGTSIRITIKITRGAGSTDENFYDFDNVKVETSSGIIENNSTLTSAFTFPNPVLKGNLLQFKNIIPGNYSLKLISPLGRVLSVETKTFSGTQKIELNTENLATGFYFIRLENDIRSYLLKLTIQ